MARDSRLSLSLHPCMITDFLKDDEPVAQELNSDASMQQAANTLKLPDYAARKKPQRKPDVIRLPLLRLDGDHTDADAALG